MKSAPNTVEHFSGTKEFHLFSQTFNTLCIKCLNTHFATLVNFHMTATVHLCCVIIFSIFNANLEISQFTYIDMAEYWLIFFLWYRIGYRLLYECGIKSHGLLVHSFVCCPFQIINIDKCCISERKSTRMSSDQGK